MLIKSINILRFILFLLSGILLCACGPPTDDKMYPLGPDARVDLIIYYKINTTEEEIALFLQNELSKPHPEGRGYYNLEGVIDVLRIQAVQGHEATALRFSANATPEQREKVKSAIMSSPIVYKVLENVIPKDVKNLD